MELSASEKELFSYIDELLPEDGQLTYDFSDEKQYRFALMLAQKSGDAERYPGRLAIIDAIRDDHLGGIKPVQPDVETTTGWQDLFAIPGLGLSPSNAIAADGLGTIVGGYSSMNLSLILQDNQSGNIVGSGFSNDFTGKVLTVNTTPAGSPDTNVTAYLHYSYTPNSSKAGASPLNAIAGVVKRGAHSGVTSDPIVTAPIRRSNSPWNPAAINIGLGRNWSDQGPNSRFDYAWAEPIQSHPIGKMPFSGSVTFQQAIKSPLVPDTGFILRIYIADQTGGGASPKMRPADLAHIYSKFSIDPNNPNKLVWDLPAGQSTHDTGDPIVFGNVPWSSDIAAFFYCGMTVLLADNSLGFAGVQSKTTPDEDTLDGITEIMPIEFIWHCLGEDTTVIGEDGKERPIGDVKAEDFVALDANGTTGKVWSTNKGIHKGDAIRLETEDGHRLTLSHNHIVMTENGGMQAEELAVGDAILSAAGLSRISAVHRDSDYDGMMYNLAMQDFSTVGESGVPVATFMANGIVVGDINAQQTLTAQRRRDIEWVKARVPALLHKDVESHFEDLGIS